MRKTLPMMAKAALAVLLTWGGTVQVGAQTPRDLIYQTYDDDDVTTSDWKYKGKSKEMTAQLTTSTDNIDEGHGKYVSMTVGTSSTTRSNTGTNYWMPVTFSDDDDKQPFSGYADATYSDKGYILEFDFKTNGATGKGTTYKGRITQLVILTVDKLSNTTVYNKSSAYSGDDYLFALSNKCPGNSNEANTTWYVNDFTYSSDHAITLAQTKTSTSTTGQDWYHLKLTVTESTASYVLTDASGSAVEGGSGSKDISGLTCKRPTYIWVPLSTKNATLSFDNFHVYDYQDNGDTHTLTAPTIAWKESHVATDETAASMTYTITFGKDDELYWRLSDGSSTLASGGPVNDENNTDVSKVGDDKLSYDVTVTQSGTLSAWSTYKESTKYADVTSLPQPKFYSVAISEQSGLCSFSSANSVLLPDGVDVYTMTDANNKVGENVEKVYLTKVDYGDADHIIPGSKGVFLYKDGGGTFSLPSYYGSTSSVSTKYDGMSSHLQGTGDSQMDFLTYGDKGWVKDGTYTVAVFCLLKNSSTLALVDLSKVSLPANKAYLKYDLTDLSSNPSAKLDIVFDDDATGVSPVAAFGDGQGTGDQNALYNLAGQRVDESYKGIVVRNGKKYLKK